ncbi:hypothetical protein A7K93_02605 [Candidatus Methylacidiphilum fumarolicum]|nr:hypothetical protein A7K73_00600 [Candidatus Methylacidiphilum fumarolicum]TFE73499.1 hypothetical protein A7K72_06240 [Candidatus Methylacidiphilum fumarolicum]TFE75038.1 hypothetical protein A7K93_02605 [Candidatus Methylacidiphilum fumarolicum]TFE76586.1 hypothetical protein A7D33_09610 [Candidatus Methylacidiphilum fumarolicum]
MHHGLEAENLKKLLPEAATVCMFKAFGRSFVPSTQPWKQLAGTAAQAVGTPAIHIRIGDISPECGRSKQWDGRKGRPSSLWDKEGHL